MGSCEKRSAPAGIVRPIRVLHVLDSFRAGGTEQGVVNLINYSNPERVQIGICVLDDHGASECLSRLHNPNIYFRSARKRFGNDPVTGVRISRFVDEGGFHIVHSHGWPTYVETWAALKLRPRILGVHGEHGTTFLERRRRRWAFSLLARRWNRFLFVSNDLKRQFESNTHISSDRMIVIPNGVDFNRFANIAAVRERDDVNFGKDWFHIGTAGRLHEVKNHWILLRAAERARDAGLQWRFHLAGDGPLRAAYETYIRDRDLGERVCLHGRLDRMEDFYHSLDLFVLTSDTEGHPNALLEALASGTPVVSTPVGDVPTFLRTGENGWLISHGDVDDLMEKIANCTSDVQHRNSVASRGQEDVRARYSIEAMTQAYGTVYESLLGHTSVHAEKSTV